LKQKEELCFSNPKMDVYEEDKQRL